MIILLILLILSIILVRLNKNNIFLVMVAVGIYFFINSNKSPILYAEKHGIYINPKNKSNVNAIEHMDNYIPDDMMTVMDNNTMALSNWDTICADAGTCRKYMETKDDFDNNIGKFNTYIDTNYDNLHNTWRTQLIENEGWEFRTKKNVYNAKHSHNTAGELIYHLKTIDYNIFLKIYNQLGYTSNIINTTYDTVNAIYEKKGYLNIRNEDKLGHKIKIVRDILGALNKLESDHPVSYPGVSVFKNVEKCKTVTQTQKLQKYDYNTFLNKEIGCPSQHYMKGIGFEKEGSNLNTNVTCCELNDNNSLNYREDLTASNTNIADNSKNIIQSANCSDKNVLNSFSYISNTVNYDLGDTIDTVSSGTTAPPSSPYKDYYMNNNHGNFLKPKLDFISKKYIVSQSNKKLYTDTGTKNEPNLNNYFHLLKTNNYYYIQVKATKHYIHVTNTQDIVLEKDIAKKSPFEILKQGDRYKLKLLNENKLLTFEGDKLVLKNTLTLETPDTNQLFHIAQYDNKIDVRVLKKCYENVDAAAETNNTVDTRTTIQLNTDLNTLHGKQLQCEKNQYLTGITKDAEHNLKGNCVNATNAINVAADTYRTDFFMLPIPSFEHTHDFIASDVLHKNNVVVGMLPFVDETQNDKLELYSSKHNVYLNTYDGYSAIQKIFITIMILRLNGAKHVNIDYNSVYKFFNKQEDLDETYNKLMHTTTTAAPTTTTTTTTTAAPTTTTTTAAPTTTTTTMPTTA
jgi:hypothetical protein